jgi:putative transposase
MHTLPKTGNLHLLGSLALFAIEAAEAGVRRAESRRQHREMLAEYQCLTGHSDEFMAAWKFPEGMFGEPPSEEFRSPLTTRLTTPGREAVFHISSRLAGDLPLWGPEERGMFREMLGKVAVYCGVGVLNYTILDNHFHLLVKVPRQTTRADFSLRDLLSRIRILHPEDSELLEEALFPKNDSLGASALEHFGARRMQGRTPLASPKESARDWALREVERHRTLMCELEMFVRLLKQRFSKWYNLTHDRFGTLWADRFRSLLVEETAEAIQAVSAYIDLNAVRRGWVDDPAEYEFCGLGEATRHAGVAREGLTEVVREYAEAPQDWHVLSERHRSLLWGDLVETGNTLAPGRPRRATELPARLGRPLVLGDFLLTKQAVLLEGLALGKTAFVQKVFRSNRAAFGSNGTWRGDQLCLDSGVLGRWIVAGLTVLRNRRGDPIKASAL